MDVTDSISAGLVAHILRCADIRIDPEDDFPPEGEALEKLHPGRLGVVAPRDGNWEVRKALRTGENGWRAETAEAGVLVHWAAGGDESWGRCTDLLIPYGCPRRQYLSLLRGAVPGLWSEIKKAWSSRGSGAFALCRRREGAKGEVPVKETEKGKV